MSRGIRWRYVGFSRMGAAFHTTNLGEEMSTVTTQTRRNAAQSAPVSDESRGKDIKRRRLALGIETTSAFALATGKDRETIARAEAGAASNSTYDLLESWLSREEEEAGIVDTPPAVSEPLKIEMHGVYGIEEIIVSGPVDRPDELAEAVAKILDRLKRGEEG